MFYKNKNKIQTVKDKILGKRETSKISKVKGDFFLLFFSFTIQVSPKIALNVKEQSLIHARCKKVTSKKIKVKPKKLFKRPKIS